MTVLRFLRLLALSLWLGSIFFFGAVLAPVVFSVLPTHAMAGQVVSRSLSSLHWIGIGCGALFLLCGVARAWMAGGATLLRTRDLLLVLMLAFTLYAQFGLGRRMNAMRVEMGAIDTLPRDDARRAEFNRLHKWSERLEGSIFLCGVVMLALIAREQDRFERN